MYGQTVPSELPNKFAMSMRQPIGVCAVITPWNFPMAIPSWKIIPALVCGNTVVFKPATLTPLSAVNFVRVLEEAGVPPGVVNLVTGGAEVGTSLSTHHDVRWFRSPDQRLWADLSDQAAASAFKKVHLEMGGKNVIMIMDDAQLELAVEGCLWGGFGTTGQRCTAASRVVVHEQVYRAFVQELTRRAKALRIGNGLDPSIHMGPLVSESQLATVANYVRNRPPRRREAGWPGGIGLATARVRKVFPRADHLRRRQPDDADRAGGNFRPGRRRHAAAGRSKRRSRSANGVPYGLSASIYTRDVNKAFAAMRDMYTGFST